MPTVTRKSSPLDAKIPEACSNEAAAVLFLEEQRGWTTDDTATCPKCGVVGESRRMKAKDGSRNARFLWRCGACKAQFTVKVGTIMEDSPIKAHHWCLAFYRAAASKPRTPLLGLCPLHTRTVHPSWHLSTPFGETWNVPQDAR